MNVCSVIIARFFRGALSNIFVNAMILQHFASQFERSSSSLMFLYSTPVSDYLQLL